MERLRAYLQLVRLPAVFTAMADVFLGFLLTHRVLEPVGEFVLLLLATSCLYLSGMAFNDVFDREQDAAERPGRPIPSGRVSVASAVRLASLLMVAGLVAAGCVGWASLGIATALAACILLYDGPLKTTPLGPVVMGACRFLNVMLAASAVDVVWEAPQLWVAATMGVYVTGITWFGRREAAESHRGELTAATLVVDLGLAGLAATVLVHDWSTDSDQTSMVFVLVVVALTINRRLFRAIQTAAPADVQAAIRVMLLSIIVLDASLVVVATGSIALGFAVAALLIPALTLGRFIWVT